MPTIGVCVWNCSDGFYGDDNERICVKCGDKYCRKCLAGGEGKCYDCEEGY